MNSVSKLNYTVLVRIEQSVSLIEDEEGCFASVCVSRHPNVHLRHVGSYFGALPE
jgi:hypothetical protein